MTETRSLKAVQTENAPAAIGPYSQGMIAGNLLFISGQLPLDPKTGEFIAGDIRKKTRQIISNIEAIAEAAGTSLDKVVKTTVFLTDLTDFAHMNEAYAESFGAAAPARSTVEVSQLPKGSEIEMEAIVSLI